MSKITKQHALPRYLCSEGIKKAERKAAKGLCTWRRLRHTYRPILGIGVLDLLFIDVIDIDITLSVDVTPIGRLNGSRWFFFSSTNATWRKDDYSASEHYVLFHYCHIIRSQSPHFDIYALGSVAWLIFALAPNHASSPVQAGTSSTLPFPLRKSQSPHIDLKNSIRSILVRFSTIDIKWCES